MDKHMKLRKLVFEDFDLGVISIGTRKAWGIEVTIEGNSTNRKQFARIFLKNKNSVDWIHFYGTISNHEEFNIRPNKKMSPEEAKKEVQYWYEDRCMSYLLRIMDIDEDTLTHEYLLKQFS